MRTRGLNKKERERERGRERERPDFAESSPALGGEIRTRESPLQIRLQGFGVLPSNGCPSWVFARAADEGCTDHLAAERRRRRFSAVEERIIKICPTC